MIYEIANIILNITLISVVIGLFYFTYVPVIEKQIVVSEVDEVMNDIEQDIKNIIPESDLKEIGEIIKPLLKKPDMTKEDEKAKENNQKLINKAIFYLSIFTAIGIGITIWMIYYFNLDWKRLLKENFITLVAVAITYFTFLTFVIRNFRGADPNVVKKSIVDAFKDF